MNRRLLLLFLFSVLTLGACKFEVCGALPETRMKELNQKLQVGDVIFVHVKSEPFASVALATRTWTNHVGVVVDVSGDEAVVAESTLPVSRTTRLSRFIGSADGGHRVAVSRLNATLDERQKAVVRSASERRLGIEYDTGFDLSSSKMFCSKFVREVLAEASGVDIGETQTLKALFDANQGISLDFWRSYFKGDILWARQTVTPASLYQSKKMQRVFDGKIRV